VRVLFCVILGLAATWARGQSAEALQLPKYPSQYYLIYTDLPETDAREAAVRMTAMAEEYQRRTADFAGRVKGRMPFFLHGSRQAYLNNGGVEGSAGYFDGSKLVAFAGKDGRTDLRTWNTVQHEGFHQFAHAVMGQTMPAWVDEGLAEYFGEAIFTGDGYVSGVIPGWRAKRVKQRLSEKQFAPTDSVLRWGLSEWNARLDNRNYDHAWSMVQFLAHADNGRYRKAFAAYLNDVAAGKPKDRAFTAHLGTYEAFEKAWRDWWLALPVDPTDRLYVRAWTEMLTSHLARATTQGQSFTNFQGFSAAVANGEIRHHREDWLPPSLAETAVERAGSESERLGVVWSLGTRGKLPTIVCTFPDKSTLTGRFTLAAGRVGKVVVDDSK
jgi:hypothetical protein